MPSETAPSTQKAEPRVPKKCLIYPLPKVVFFYPTMLTAFFCAIVTTRIEKDIVPKALGYGYLNHDYIEGEHKDKNLEAAEGGREISVPKWNRENRNDWREISEDVGATGEDPGVRPSYWCGWIFLIVFTLNVLVISFEFPGVKAMAVAFLGLAILFGGAWLNYQINFLPFLADAVKGLKPYASTHLYLYMAILFAIVILISVLVNRYWNRWILEPNRLVHKHGMLGDVREWPTLNIQLTKQITDVFEWILLLSGSLVIKTGDPNQPPIVLENVPWINFKEKQIRRILEAWELRNR